MASQTEEWQRLFEVTQTAADIIPTPDAVQSQLIRFKEWTFSYATSGLNDESLAALSRYVTSMECVSQYESVLAGEVKNVSEIMRFYIILVETLNQRYTRNCGPI